jgi:hypothetical protein
VRSTSEELLPKVSLREGKGLMSNPVCDGRPLAKSSTATMQRQRGRESPGQSPRLPSICRWSRLIRSPVLQFSGAGRQGNRLRSG